MNKQPAVYIMASRRNGTIYTGVTSNLPQRAWQHRTNAVAGFTKQYRCEMLVWYELHVTMPNAIVREKQVKAGSRKKKLALIEATNPSWRDLVRGADLIRHCERSEAIQGRLAVAARLFWIASSPRASQ